MKDQRAVQETVKDDWISNRETYNLNQNSIAKREKNPICIRSDKETQITP